VLWPDSAHRALVRGLEAARRPALPDRREIKGDIESSSTTTGNSMSARADASNAAATAACHPRYKTASPPKGKAGGGWVSPRSSR